MPEFNLPIAALGQLGNESIMFETDDEFSLLRAAQLFSEFKIPVVHIGSGHEYEAVADIAALGQTVIIPVNYPKAPSVKEAEDELDINLADLRYWDQAPANAASLEKAGVRFAFTTYRLKETKNFLKHVRLAVSYGLTPSTALAALTTIPAQICGLESEIGTLETGKFANFIVTDGDIFDPQTRLYAVIVKGDRRDLLPLDQTDFRGEYSIDLDGRAFTLSLKGAIDTTRGELSFGGIKSNLENVVTGRDELTFSAKLDSLGYKGVARFLLRREAVRACRIGHLSRPVNLWHSGDSDCAIRSRKERDAGLFGHLQSDFPQQSIRRYFPAASRRSLDQKRHDLDLGE